MAKPRRKKRYEEYLASKTRDKQVFNFVNDDLGINIKSREVHLQTKRVIHYPFNRQGKQKYSKISEIIYQNLPDPLPRGIIKNWRLGYGFTKVLNPVLYMLESKVEVTRIIVKPKCKFKLIDHVVQLSYEDLNRFYPKMDSLMKKQNSEKEKLTANFLHSLFPEKFHATAMPSYKKGTIYSLISDQLGKNSMLSKDDYDAMLGVVVSKLGEQTKESRQVVVATKEKIEIKFLEDAVIEFKRLFHQKSYTKNLEKKWEEILKEHSWIISNLFSLPLFLFANQAYVGGKEIFNVGGKITDFLFKNSLTDNLTLIELKTHKTELLAKKPYRGNDVYSLSEELSGAVNQVLDQKQNLLNEFYALRSKAGQEEWFESFNSKCLIIAGTIKDLPKNGRKSFEIFRNNLHGVEIITFDEVLQKIESFASLLKANKERKKN